MARVFTIISSLFSIVWFVVLFRIIMAIAGKASGSGKTAKKGFKGFAQSSEQSIPSSYPSPAKPAARKHKPSKLAAAPRREVDMEKLTEDHPLKGLCASTVLKEDRSNDWLAKQMREEQRILMKSEMYELKEAHAASCEARELKEIHRQNHGIG